MTLFSINILNAQEWIDINTTMINYFSELPEAERLVELIRNTSLNPSSEIRRVSEDGSLYEIVLTDEYIVVEIGPLHIKAPIVRKRLIGYYYRNEITQETINYIIYETPAAPKASLIYRNGNTTIRYLFYEDREEKYEIDLPDYRFH